MLYQWRDAKGRMIAKAWHYEGRAYRIEAAMYVDDKAEAQAIADQFPKSVKLYAGTLHASHEPEGRDYGYVQFVAGLSSDKVNGGVNETGLKRWASFLKNAEKLGIAVEWDTEPAPQKYATREAFEEALAGATR